jgi:uncharacterized protein YlxW (UPF0749 family)
MKNRNVMKSVTFTIVCLLLGIIIALQLKSINSSRNTALAENLRADELSQEVMDLMKKNSELVDRIDLLTAAQRQIDNQSAGQETQLQRIITERDNAEIFAGLRDVSGPGGLITMMCSKNAFIKDSDLRLVVNMLRAYGVQAMSINGERLVAMSEIITAGSNININGHPFPNNGQFEIKVIMDSTKLSTSLGMLQGALSQLKQYGIDTVPTPMESVKIDRLREDSPAYRKDLLTPGGA